MLKELFSNTFLAELEEVGNKFAEPNAELTTSDVAVGEMNELEKAIYTLSNKKAKLAGMSVLQLSYENLSNEEKDKLMHAAYSLRSQSDTLKEIMWVLIKDRLDLWSKSIGIRKGFCVVWFDEQKAMGGMKDLLDLLLSRPSGD